MVEKGEIEYAEQFVKKADKVTGKIAQVNSINARLTKDINDAMGQVRQDNDLNGFVTRVRWCIKRERAKLRNVLRAWKKEQPPFLEAAAWLGENRPEMVAEFVEGSARDRDLIATLQEFSEECGGVFNNLVVLRNRNIGRGLSEAVDEFAQQYEILIGLILELRRDLGTASGTRQPANT